MEDDIYAQLKELTIKYSAAMQQIETYLKILEEDFTYRYDYNPIDHVITRLKTPESILEKVARNSYNRNIEDIEKNIFDIAGIRIVCPFEDDVMRVVNIIKESHHVELIKEKDYISKPKKSGYRSYHLVIRAHIHLITGSVYVPVEIQVRTLAQDFWASLEHQITYKYNGAVPKRITDELHECSDVADLLDKKMLELSNNLHT